jgi:cyclopropane fatty-acyl-phospholipid synthase-like methyltransferase
MIEFLILFLLVSLVIVGSMFYIFPWFFGAPYEPISEEKLDKLFEISNVKKGDKVVDLGSGDGRIVMGFAKKGILAHGFEINPILVLLSRWRIKRAGLEKNAFIYWKNFWNVDLYCYDVVVFFQYKTIMKRLRNKFKKELNSGAKILSYYWDFPEWKSLKQKSGIYLYKI